MSFISLGPLAMKTQLYTVRCSAKPPVALTSPPVWVIPLQMRRDQGAEHTTNKDSVPKLIYIQMHLPDVELSNQNARSNNVGFGQGDSFSPLFHESIMKVSKIGSKYFLKERSSPIKGTVFRGEEGRRG